jgi:cobalt/nickel transport system permease protein
MLVIWSSCRVRDEDIPRIGLLTAAFFVTSEIRVDVGPTSVHLLLSALVGIVLGSRAVIAVAIGLFLQKVLLGHGGFTSLGLNCVIIALPALFARPAFLALRQQRPPSFRWRDGGLAVAYILHPLLMAGTATTGLTVEWALRGRTPEANFRAGFAVGLGCVLATALLNAAVLLVAGVEDWRAVAALVVAVHIPLAFVEGIIVGSAAMFISRVKPELLEMTNRR